MEDPLRAFKALMTWIPICAVIDAVILIWIF